MNEDRIIELMFRRYDAAQTPLGRLFLRLHVFQQRLWAGLLTTGADSAKRAFDVLVSAVALVLLSPLFLIIAIFVKIEDHGPVFFAKFAWDNSGGSSGCSKSVRCASMPSSGSRICWKG